MRGIHRHLAAGLATVLGVSLGPAVPAAAAPTPPQARADQAEIQ